MSIMGVLPKSLKHCALLASSSTILVYTQFKSCISCGTSISQIQQAQGLKGKVIWLIGETILRRISLLCATVARWLERGLQKDYLANLEWWLHSQLKGQHWNQMFWLIVGHGPWPETSKMPTPYSWTNQMGDKRRRKKERMKTFLNFTFLRKTKPRRKAAGSFPTLF